MLKVNGEEVMVKDCAPATSLSEVLRDSLNLTGTKRGCDSGGCGMCTVLLDGRLVYSCMTPCWKAEGRSVTTIEGNTPTGAKLDRLQQAFSRNFAPQCGYCTGAMLLAGKAFLNDYNALLEKDADSNFVANEEEVEHNIKEALCGVLCRCTGYLPYIESIKELAMEDKKKYDQRPVSRK